MTRIFSELLQAQQEQGKCLCVGLDPDFSKLPQPIVREPHPTVRIFEFNARIVDQTYTRVCAYKPNIAFYEDRGSDGIEALGKTIRYINRVAPEVPVILDAKRADIGNTNAGYVRSAFEYFEADAITVNPYFGAEALQPFLKLPEKGIFVLCRTSNPGAGEFQDLPVTRYSIPLYRIVAQRVAREWNKNNNCGLVVGATAPEELRAVRQDIGDMPILIPGVGTQGGDLKKAVEFGKNSLGRGFLINSSSGVIFSADPGKEAARLDNEIQEALGLVPVN